jgi:type IV secretory pathway VirJ component
VASLALVAPSETASFEFHVAGWLGLPGSEMLATRPEMDRLTVPTACIAPADEPAPSCSSSNPRVRVATAPPGHHFSGEYDRLVALLLR